MAAAVVVGGAGALGSAIVRALGRRRQQQALGLPNTHQQNTMPIVSVDFRPCPDPEATHSVVLPTATASADAWAAAGERAVEEVRAVLAERGQGCGSVFHAAGGWAGGAPGAGGFLGSVDRMWRMNGQSAALAAHLAGALLLPNPTRQQPPPQTPPLVVLTGAAAALDPGACAGMVGYGMSKAATHFLVRCLAAQFDNAKPPKPTTVLAVLPTTLDTPANRAAMPGADVGGWTKPEDMAAQLAEWAFDPSTRPAAAPSGALLKVVTSKGQTTWEPAS